ncbi:hypothetical protein GOBAR_AA27566 [Gossypium barbadense]|uniref:SWIM-type domain-containing protein n=1 Tax=Gossypium barbadense TaxID=3634 RepID=A0A2P5WPU5_GOSBA|nr:hypothetical protein GOBAR_AA27566 [Gossypium barbadense]
MVANLRMARSMSVKVYSRHLETFRVIETIGHQLSIAPRSYEVDLWNRRRDCRRFQTLHYPCVHVVAACAIVSFNSARCVSGRMSSLSYLTYLCGEVPLTTFELVPDKKLRRNPKSCPQSTRIRNEMDNREKSDGKCCGLCKLASHNRSKCPQRNYYVGQSSRSGRN